MSWRGLKLFSSGPLAAVLGLKVRSIDICTCQSLMDAELYLMAFGPLRAVFTVTALNDLISVMVERGLRMRRDIEEFLDDWEDPAMIVERIDEGNEGDAELETLMYDREQAKPY